MKQRLNKLRRLEPVLSLSLSGLNSPSLRLLECSNNLLPSFVRQSHIALITPEIILKYSLYTSFVDGLPLSFARIVVKYKTILELEGSLASRTGILAGRRRGFSVANRLHPKISIWELPFISRNTD